MDEEDIPDISDLDVRELCSILLGIVALFAGFTAMNASITDPARGIAFLGIVAGLAAIAFAILAVGRYMTHSDS